MSHSDSKMPPSHSRRYIPVLVVILTLIVLILYFTVDLIYPLTQLFNQLAPLSLKNAILQLVSNHSSYLIDHGGTSCRVTHTHFFPADNAFFGTWDHVPSAQGVTNSTHGLIFSGRSLLRQTSQSYSSGSQSSHLLNKHPTPPHLKHYHHIGDISTLPVANGELVLASIEEPQYKFPRLVVFNSSDLGFLWDCPLNQHHTSFLAIDQNTMIMYSTEFRHVTEVKRYTFPDCHEITPLKLSLPLDQVQGGSVFANHLYLSTNQIPHNPGNIFAVNLLTGNIDVALSLQMGMGRAETEGIDVSYYKGQIRILILMNYLHLFSGLTQLICPTLNETR